MKVTKTSFLFFSFICINTMCVFNYPLISQTANDSTLFYYKSITEIKDINATGKAFNFFEEKAEEALSDSDTIQAAYYLELISLGQFKMGFSNECESTTIKALNLLDHIKENSKTREPKERLLNQLGMLYRKIKDFNNSHRYYNQALELNKSPVDKIAIVTNVATNYADQGQYKKAIQELYKYYDDVLLLKNSSIKATFLDNLGYYQSKTNDDEALKNIKLSLKIRLELEDLTGLFSSYRHLTLYYYEKGNKEYAFNYSEMAKKTSDLLDNGAYQKEAIKLSLKLKNNLEFNEYLLLSDSIESVNQTRENKFAAMKYNVTEKERLIKESELQKEKQEKLKLIYLFFGLTIFLIAVFLILIQKFRHKKQKIQQVYNTETRISKKIHDEVANDVYHIMTKLQSENKTNEDVLDDLEGVYNKTRDISKENSTVDVNANYSELLNDLLLSYKTNDINVVTRNISKINWDSVPDIKKTTLHRVLQELMTNMRKHSKATIVALTFSDVKNKIIIDYKDNGVGCAIKKNSGLLNAENRIASINGTITFESRVDDGFKAKIII